MRFIQKLKQYERNYMFLRWATAEEYGKLKYVGYDFVEFDIINLETMEFRETVLINSQLILEAMVGGADIARIIAEVSSKL
ncbi:MAG: hypothetical protein PHC64_07135 [Candidatus Gastranaerophilales bacterium]|nr:hypothetical protein [Candidatus Gastranaerophilales bacterium]